MHRTILIILKNSPEAAIVFHNSWNEFDAIFAGYATIQNQITKTMSSEGLIPAIQYSIYFSYCIKILEQLLQCREKAQTLLGVTQYIFHDFHKEMKSTQTK